MFSNPPPTETQEPDRREAVHPRAANRGWLHRARAAGLTAGALLSYVALSLYANADGEAMVSQTRLAADCGVTDRTIRNHLRRWQRAGLLEARTRCGPRGLTLYRLAPPDLAAAGVGPGRQQVPVSSPAPARPGPARVAPPRPETARKAVGAPEACSPETALHADRNQLVPTKTGGERERLANSLSPSLVATPRAWQRSPAPLAPGGARPAATSTARGSAYAPGSDAHAAASSVTPVRAAPAAAPIAGATAPTPAPPAAQLGAVRNALAWLREQSKRRDFERAQLSLSLGATSSPDPDAPALSWELGEELSEGATAHPRSATSATGAPERPEPPRGEPVALGALLPPLPTGKAKPRPPPGDGGQ